MAQLEVCLVNDLPMIGYLSAILKKPDAIVWLRTPNQKQVVSTIESSLSGQLSASFESREIHQNDIPEFIEQCEKILKDYPEHKTVLNISGGSRLHAFLAAEIFKNAGKEVVLIDPDHLRIVDVKTGDAKTFQFNLTVNEYIALHGIKMESGTRFDPEIGKRSALSFFIGNNLERTVPFIDAHRDEWNNMGDVKAAVHWKIEDQRLRFVINYDPEQKSMRFRFGSGENTKTIDIPEDGGSYLFNGGWLRELVFLRVHRSQYDDVRLNVRLDRESVAERKRFESMIDIGMMKGCNFYIFQCFSYPITRESFIELQAVNETVKLLKAKGFIFMSHRPHHGFIERARDDGLEVITGRRIANFTL
ncbi:MAG: DUF1887 family CARF protein [Candidatus Marinimicrobia bacterium]|jgi:hypothetical protein|nr:DUF1887 family CARF protein [Candidatus Neomarinimicrobiota bacterium]MCK9560622.1 DUF1887 family CARF protein [Candidatus Neomarinimicrobiota bacterium]